MSEGEKTSGILGEIKEIYLFLTKGEPSPDDEIDAREQLLKKFGELSKSIAFKDQNGEIKKILEILQDWDTLDLWFLETSLPGHIEQFLNISDDEVVEIETKQETHSIDENKRENAEIDIGEIVNKVSQQFKGEIDVLKDTIENLKKELNKKDETSKEVSHKKVQKITPKKNVKLPPPKIKIPIIKKTIPQNEEKIKKSIPSIPEKPPQKKSPSPVKVAEISEKQDLTPIPSKPIELKSKKTDGKELTPIPVKKPEISTTVIEESKDKPLITQKVKVTSVLREKKTDETKNHKEKNPVAFSAEKPKISSVSVEEVDTGAIKSSGLDLFDVLSSVGENNQVSTDEKIKEKTKSIPEEQNVKEISLEAQVIEKAPEQESEEPKEISSFVGFKNNTFASESEKSDELPQDKDALYQELIALEGKRYAIEKRFKELETSYNKGSISDMQYKNHNEEIKLKMQEITTRINTIRRLISSL